MSREHHKEHKSKRSRDPDEAHRSHKHKSHKSHKPHKLPKSPKIHKSRRNHSKSPPPAPAEDEAQMFTRILQEKIFAPLALDPVPSARKQNHQAKVRYVEQSPGPFVKLAKVSKVKTPVKVANTVSIAGIFKRPNHQPPAKKEKKIKKKIPDPDPPLAIELQEQLEITFATLRKNAKDSFDTIHAQYTENIKKTRAQDVKLIKSVTAAADSLRAPLVDEKVEIVMLNNGKREKHTVTLGKRVDSFKSLIAEEKANLKDLWSQWNAVQDEYKQLGIEVFGIEALGDGFPGEIARGVNGFKKEMEEVDLQHNSAVEELNEEIGGLKVKSMKRLKSAEKELDQAAKKDQEVVLRKLLFV